MAEDGSAAKSVRMRAQRYRNWVKQALKPSLKRAIAKGEISPGNSEHRANLLFVMVLGFNIAVRGGASKNELQALLEAVSDQINQRKPT